MNLEPRVFTSEDGATFLYWSSGDLRELWSGTGDLKRLADGCRLNALSAIQRAGSGHIGTSFSSMDIMIAVRRFLQKDKFMTGKPLEQVFFSSKGHDAPAVYAMLHADGELSDQQLFSLRRLGGLPGHPETITPGIRTNTGSLGMGISKAKGFAKAQRLENPDDRSPVVVLLGDGELNEGQIWESMPGAVKEGLSEVIAVVDGNQIQSDTWTRSTLPMGDVRARVEAVGWNFVECEGNDPHLILAALESAELDPRPSFVWAQTTKGSGIPWMEQFPVDGEFYHFHSGALSQELYDDASDILVGRYRGNAESQRSGRASTRVLASDTPKVRPVSMVTVWENMLCQIMEENPAVVALDGDLSYDTGTHIARHQFPDRYLQCGIAEQDMVSMAGTLSLSGRVPIVHSFATFLTMRAAEQIFNNATEGSTVIYLGFMAGVVPSAAGFSHQAVTDVGMMASVPGMRVFEPASRDEMRWCCEQALAHRGPSYIRVGSIAPITEPEESPRALRKVAAGSGLAFLSSGPLFTEQACAAREMLVAEGHKAPAVFSWPEVSAPLSVGDMQTLETFERIVVLENHTPALAKHQLLVSDSDVALSRVDRVGLVGLPQNGQPLEVMKHHGFDAESLVALVSAVESRARAKVVETGATYEAREAH